MKVGLISIPVKERMNRTANREHTRSEAELNELCESMQAKENRVKKMKALAVVVPNLLDSDERRFQFVDRNGKIDDPMELYKRNVKDSVRIPSFA